MIFICFIHGKILNLLEKLCSLWKRNVWSSEVKNFGYVHNVWCPLKIWTQWITELMWNSGILKRVSGRKNRLQQHQWQHQQQYHRYTLALFTWWEPTKPKIEMWIGTMSVYLVNKSILRNVLQYIWPITIPYMYIDCIWCEYVFSKCMGTLKTKMEKKTREEVEEHNAFDKKKCT